MDRAVRSARDRERPEPRWPAPRRLVCGLAATLAVVVGVVALPAPAPAQPEVGEDEQAAEREGSVEPGPIRVRDQFILGVAYLQLDPESADLLPSGSWQIDVIQSATNNWVQSEEIEDLLEGREQRQPLTLEELQAVEPVRESSGLYLADGEAYRLSVKVRHSLTDWMQLAVTLPVMKFSGGFGDTPIQEMHELLGIDQGGREGVPRNEYTIYIRPGGPGGGTELYVDEAPSAGLGDVSSSLKVRLSPRAARWAVALEGVVEFPTGDARKLYGSGELDFGGQLLATLDAERSCFHLGLGVVRTGGSELLAAVSPRTVLNLFAGYERAVSERWAWVAQTTFSESPLADLAIRALSEDQFLIDLAIKRSLGGDGRGTVFLAFSENFRNFGNSPDLGLHLGFSRTWR